MELKQEIASRKKKLAKWLKEDDFSAAVFLKEEIEFVNGNFLYYGGSETSDEYCAIIVDSQENSYAIAHEYSFERAKKSGLYNQVFEIRQSMEQLALLLKKLVTEKLSGAKVAFDMGALTADTAALIRYAGVTVNDNSQLRNFVYDQRSIKSAYEIDEIEKAIDAASKALRKTVDSFKQGMTPEEISKTLVKHMVDNGGMPSFETDIRIRRGMNETEIDKLERGDLVMFDFGARLHSQYLSDVGRTIMFGSSQATRDFMSQVYSIKREGLKKIRSGISGNDVRREIDALIREHGFYSTHRPGHQIGLNVHEPYGPHLAYGEENSAALKTGNVVTWEPGIGLKDDKLPKNRYGMEHMEDMVLVGETSKMLGNLELEFS
jgi:Xaa-Pro aminopeptidase